MKVWRIGAESQQVEEFELGTYAQLRAKSAGVLGYVSKRFFDGRMVDVRRVRWLGEVRLMALHDSGLAQSLALNEIATGAYRLQHPDVNAHVVGDAVVLDQLECHPLCDDRSATDRMQGIEGEMDAFLRGCGCDYCTHLDIAGGVHRARHASITCPKCRRTSYHPQDIKRRYCANCKEFRS